MSPSTCSKTWPRVSTRSVVSAQNMKASSGSGLWPILIFTKRGHANTGPASRASAAWHELLERSPPSAGESAVEEPALEQREHLLARERPRVDGPAVGLAHDDIVLERLVRAREGIVELGALEDEILGPRLVRLPQLRVDGARDRPHAARATLDPEHDPLLGARIVHTDERALGKPAFAR